jgi:predicted porin
MVTKSRFLSGGVIGTPLAERKPGLSRRYGAAATAEKAHERTDNGGSCFMNKRTKLSVAVGAICMVPITQAIAGIDVNAGDWKIDFSGNVNAFYVATQCDHATTDPGSTTSVTGGLACTGDHSAAVRNGLLPAALVFSATTRQADFDIDVTIGFYPGINSSAAAGVNGAGQPAALSTPGIDARQAYFTFGDVSWGTIKMGRDIGLFGKDAILDDMTLLGVGTSSSTAAPGNTSLGRIGVGYIYTDWQPQITYTSASYNGFSGSVGVFQPLTSGVYTSHSSPQIQAGLAYAFGDPKSDAVSGKVFVDAITQKLRQDTSSIVPGTTASFNGTGVDGGVKLDVAGFEAVLYGYTGKGIGTTGFFILATDAEGQKRKSDGGYIQATYKWDKFKFGLSYGESDLKLADGEIQVGNNLVKRNASGVAGVYYSLTKSITLVGEFVDTKSTAWGSTVVGNTANSATEKDLAVGGILFF